MQAFGTTFPSLTPGAAPGRGQGAFVNHTQAVTSRLQGSRERPAPLYSPVGGAGMATAATRDRRQTEMASVKSQLQQRVSQPHGDTQRNAQHSQTLSPGTLMGFSSAPPILKG